MKIQVKFNIRFSYVSVKFIKLLFFCNEFCLKEIILDSHDPQSISS